MRRSEKYLAAYLTVSLFSGLAWGQSIRGTVVDTQGKPIAGAVIYAVDSQSRLRVNNNLVLTAEKYPRTLSDSDGYFSFPKLRRPARLLLARDIEDRFAWLTGPVPDRDIRITMQDSAEVIGQLWRGKSPLQKKEVTAILSTGTSQFFYFATTRTDQEGRFIFKSLPAGEYRFRTIDPVPQVGCSFRSVPTREAHATLEPGRSHSVQIGGTDLPYLRGNVTDTDDNPLHGVWVYLTSTDGISAGGQWSDVTEKDGSFAIYDIPPGHYTLHCFRRLALNNSSRTLQVARPVTITDRSNPDTPPVPFAENVGNISIDLAPFMPLEIGKPAPPLKTKTTAGHDIDLENERGKTVVLHFYASWCIACVNNFAGYDKLTDRFASEKLTVIGINLDNTLEECRSFLKQNSPRHAQVFAGPWNDSWAVRDFHIADIPSNLIVDTQGVVIQKDLFGKVLEAFLEKQLSNDSHKP